MARMKFYIAAFIISTTTLYSASFSDHLSRQAAIKAEQDAQLSSIGNMLDELGIKAKNTSDELTSQRKLLDKTSLEIDHAQANVDGTTRKTDKLRRGEIGCCDCCTIS